MDFGSLFKSCWEKFIKEIVTVILFTLVGALLSLTIILIPTVSGGWVRGFVGYVRDGKKPEFSELWNFDGYVQILLLILVAGVLTAIGYMLLVIPGIILNVWWLYALFFVVDRKMDFWGAMGASREAVSRTGFFNNLIVLLILCVLNALGSALSGLGTIFTLPFSMILLSVVYLDVTKKRGGNEQTQESTS